MALKRERWNVLAWAALVLAAISGCAAGHPDAAGTGEGTVSRRLTGIITYRERIPLPRDVWIRLELLDVSGKDGPPRTIALQEFESAGRQLPIPFDIPYRPAIIDPERAYAIRVKIFQGRRILFVNASTDHVITNGVRNNIEVVVESVPGTGGSSQ